MEKLPVLNVGICECTSLLHGQLSGREVSIKSVRAEDLSEPRRFILQETRITRFHSRQPRALKDSGCQIFLDVHGWNGFNNLFVDLTKVIKNEQRGTYRIYTRCKTECLDWQGTETPPTVDQVINLISKVIGEYFYLEEDLDVWLSSWAEMKGRFS